MSEHISWAHQEVILQYIPSRYLHSLRLVSRRWNWSIRKVLHKRGNEFQKNIKNPSLFRIECISVEKSNGLIFDDQKLCIVGDTLYRFGGCHHYRYTNMFEQFPLFGDGRWSCVDVQGPVRPPPTSKAQLVVFERPDPFIVLTSDVIRPISRHLTEIMYSLHGLVFIFNVKNKVWNKFELHQLKNLHSYTTFFVGSKIVFHGSLQEPERSPDNFVYVFDVKTHSFCRFSGAGYPCYSTFYYVVNDSKVIAFPILYENMRSFRDPFVSLMTFDWSSKRVEIQILDVSPNSHVVFYPVHTQQVLNHVLSFFTSDPTSEHAVTVNYPKHLEEAQGFGDFFSGMSLQVTYIDPIISLDMDFSTVSTEGVFFNLGLHCLSVSFLVYWDAIYAVCRVKHNNCYYRNVYYIY